MEDDGVQMDRKADNVAVLVWCQLIVLKSNLHWNSDINSNTNTL